MANFVLISARSPEVSSDGYYLYSPISITGTVESGQLYIGWSNGNRSGTINYSNRLYNTFSSYQYSVTQTDVTYGGVGYRFLYAVLSEYTAGSVTRQWFYTSTNNTIRPTPPTSAHVYFLTLIYARIYTVTYNPNGGTVSPTSESVAYKDSVTLPTPTFANSTLIGWYSGNTKVGDAGGSYTITGDVTLIAKWNRYLSSGDFMFWGGILPELNVGTWQVNQSDVNSDYTVTWNITKDDFERNGHTWHFRYFEFYTEDLYGNRTYYRPNTLTGSQTVNDYTIRYPSGMIYYFYRSDNLLCLYSSGKLMIDYNWNLTYGNKTISY